MTPQNFEALAEQTQETIQMQDERIAANVLDRTLSMMNGTEPQLTTSHTVFQSNPDIFSSQPGLSSLRNQENGFPDNHDCTSCAVHVSACALLQAAKESSPFADRLSVVSQLSGLVEGFKDLPKEQVESLIKEGMSVIKAKREGLKNTSAAETSSPIDSLTSQQSELVKKPEPIIESVVQKPQIPDHILKMRQGTKPEQPANVPEPITISSRKVEPPAQPEIFHEPVEQKLSVEPVQHPEPPLIKIVEVANAPIEHTPLPEPTQTIAEVLEAPQQPPAMKVTTVHREIFIPKHDSIRPPRITIKEPTQVIIPRREEPKSTNVSSESIDHSAESNIVETVQRDEPSEYQEMENVMYAGEPQPDVATINISESINTSDNSLFQNETIPTYKDISTENSTEINTHNIFTFQETPVVLQNDDLLAEQTPQEIPNDNFVENTPAEIPEEVAETTTVFQQERPVEELEPESDSHHEVIKNVAVTEPNISFQDEIALEENSFSEIIDENKPEIKLGETENKSISLDVESTEDSNEIKKNSDESFREIKIINLEKEKAAENSLKGIKEIITKLPNKNNKEKQSFWIERINSDPALTDFSELLDNILLQLLLINNPQLTTEINFEKATSSSSLLYLYQLQDASQEENRKQKYNSNNKPLTYFELITYLWSYSNALMNSITTQPIAA